jgi:hypothetical protein
MLCYVALLIATTCSWNPTKIGPESQIKHDFNLLAKCLSLEIVCKLGSLGPSIEGIWFCIRDNALMFYFQ